MNREKQSRIWRAGCLKRCWCSWWTDVIEGYLPLPWCRCFRWFGERGFAAARSIGLRYTLTSCGVGRSSGWSEGMDNQDSSNQETPGSCSQRHCSGVSLSEKQSESWRHCWSSRHRRRRRNLLLLSVSNRPRPCYDLWYPGLFLWMQDIWRMLKDFTDLLSLRKWMREMIRRKILNDTIGIHIHKTTISQLIWIAAGSQSFQLTDCAVLIRTGTEID